MIFALVAGAVTLAVIIIVAVIVLRRRTLAQKGHVKATREVNHISTVGVESTVNTGRFSKIVPSIAPKGDLPTSSLGDALSGRFVAMGVLSAAVFGSLAAKLWSMQVLNSAAYAQKSAENLYTTVYTPAPRGIIYDYNGIPLVKNKSSYAVLATADAANDHDVIMRLSALLGMPREVVRQRILSTSGGAQNNRVVVSDTTRRNLAFITEHADAFPGISCETRTVRTYPFGTLAAHVLGYTGTASDEDLENQTLGRSIQSGDVVGKSGVEASYDDVLAGDHGTRTLLTDAQGEIQQVVSVTDPARGNDIYLTIRGPVQKVADDTLRTYIEKEVGTAAAVVCLDARNGDVVALANYPTYNPESFIGGISNEVWEQFNTEASHYPLLDRAIGGTYPAASTFKAFTAMAALTCGVTTSSETHVCEGTWTGFGPDYPQNCWDLGGHGKLDLVGGIANSCDVVFYDLAKGFFDRTEELGANAMQDYLVEYGFGQPLGIDLGGEAAGRVPTGQWKAEYFKDAPEEGKWQGGDLTNMVIGQGYVLVTPLQIAAGYCGIGTGKIYRPHVLKEVRNSVGEVVVRYQPEVIYEPTYNEYNLSVVQAGLREVMSLNGYMRYFGDVDFTVAGKTGTAEVFGKKDFSWFACYAPANDPKYVVAIIVEEGPSTATSSIPMGSAVLKAAMEYDSGIVENRMVANDGTVYAGNPDGPAEVTGHVDPASLEAQDEDNTDEYAQWWEGSTVGAFDEGSWASVNNAAGTASQDGTGGVV